MNQIEQFQKQCAAEMTQMDCAHRCGIGKEVEQKILSMPLPEVKQEPVAWLYHDAPSLDIFLRNKCDAHLIYSIGLSLVRKPNCRNETALYAMPPDAEALRDALIDLISIVKIHQEATKNRFAWAEIDCAEEALKGRAA